MSRLYEALSRATSDQRMLEALRQDLHPSDADPFDSKNIVEVPNIVLPLKAVEAEAALERDEARLVTVKAPPWSRLVAWSDPNSLGAEKFRALATRLDHMRKQITLKSLQVTSSVVNEGKSLVSANLAVTFAKYSGAQTLLIEGDLHRGTLASMFGLGELQGLTDWWPGGDQEIMHYLYRFSGMPLWFLAAGKPHDQPPDILRSERLAAAFAELASSFNWIVVDSTPMLPIIDANLWSRFVDGTLLVVREGMAPVKALKKGLQSLDHPKLIGVVINESCPFDQDSYKNNYCGRRPHWGKATEKKAEAPKSPSTAKRI